jgi:quercetin dioxygenase-like cupin family protein
MNLSDVITVSEKAVTAKNVLKATGTVTLLQIKKGGILNHHQSQTDALLVLLSGQAVYEEEERSVVLTQIHDFVQIPARVTHRVVGEEESLLLLIQ